MRIDQQLSNPTGAVHRGFTLVELMVVIAIVGILASLTVPSYRSYVQQATVSKAFDLLQKAKTEVGEKYALTGNFPVGGTTYFEDTASDADIRTVYFYNGSAGTHLVANFGPGNSTLDNKRLWLVADDTNPDQIKWTCTSHFIARLAIPDDALPSGCQ